MTVKKPATTAAPRKAAPRVAASKAAPPKASRAALRRPVPLAGDALDGAILRHLRTKPNQVVDLAPLATELEVDPIAMQLAVERLHQRRMVVAPFIEPGRAGGAELTEVGLRWLIAREGGKPQDTPVAFQPAKGHVRPQDEAARLPRAQVYGVRR